MTAPYDSRPDTIQHINTVRDYLNKFGDGLWLRGRVHDASKLETPEKAAFDLNTPKLKGLTYGSAEYMVLLEEMEPATQHHYENNSHHIEHRPEGVAGMDLLDLVEMLCDWCAAVKRHSDGNILDSIAINTERFHLDPQVASILRNTVTRMGWDK